MALRSLPARQSNPFAKSTSASVNTSPSGSPLSRRALLRGSVLGLASAPFVAVGADAPKATKSTKAPAKAPSPAEPTALNRFPRMMQEYYVRRVREAEVKANARRAIIRTRADAEAYLAQIRTKIGQCFGPKPEKTPLNARITGVVDRDAYKIEKVIFESRPGFPVTANLYLPKGKPFPRPGVVGTCGHSANGKAGETYQSFAQGLARLGYVVFIFDPIGQGERLQYVTPELKPKHGTGVREHLHAGNQQTLVGEFFGAWRVWDGIRALDYLLTRPEVDPKQVGLTGNSGGGTDTAWLCGAESRWAMAAPGCFVTTFRRNLENELPADTEQCPPHALALGLDHSDFMAALAPKPIILLDQEKDYFDARGHEEAFARLQAIYRLLGAEQDVRSFLGPDYHGYSPALRTEMYRWFNRVTKASNATTEPALTIEKDETLWCTPRGQVGEASPRNVLSFTRELSAAQAQRRGEVSGDRLVHGINEVLQLPPRTGAPEYRILRPGNNRGYPKRYAGTYAVETEPGVFALTYRLDDNPLLSRVPRGPTRAVLYVAHRSADAELRREPLIKEIVAAERDSAIFACDVRGLGESWPNTCGVDAADAYGADYFYAAHGLMLDWPMVAQRTHDLLCLVDWLKSAGHREVHLVARGWGALPATLAAVLSADVKQVTLKNALSSYRELAEAEDYKWPLSAMLPGVLQFFDLPDCYRALAAKQLRQIEPWGAMAG